MRAWLFVFFLVSGFCSLVDEVVWLRIAMAEFGVVTPLISTVLSVFMAGLALGSWQAGRLVLRARPSTVWTPLRLYALAELAIASSAFIVPPLLGIGRQLLLRSEDGGSWGSLGYHLASGAWIAVTLLPFCLCMGATFPLGLAVLRGTFGRLYVANVLGATLGTLLSAFVLIELLGFRGTLRAAAALNVAIGLGALALAARRAPRPEAAAPVAASPAPAPAGQGASMLTMLFVTGLVSMAMEVVWVRQFTPYMGTVVYTFATILALYLAATFAGSALYRRRAERSGAGSSGSALGYGWMAAGAFGLLPLIATDPRVPLPILDWNAAQPGHSFLTGLSRVTLGIVLFCATVGFITPMLVDRYSSGDPERAGRAYAVNVTGCILGPLVACFVLLPEISERWSIAALSAPLFAMVPLAARTRKLAFAAVLLVGLGIVAGTQEYVDLFPTRELRRDYEATVIATDARGPKELLVNGVGITIMTPITKMMIHVPMAFLEQPPRDALVICFGMGTTFRSALSWDVPTTVAELVPSVPSLIGFYHADGAQLLRSPRAKVVIDDGRRYLERSADQFDVISLDPPPPIEAAASSLLYSREFYELARRRLRPGGILQQWFPGGEPAIFAAVTRALTESFPHVRVFPSVEGWGIHYLASDRPIPPTPASVLAARLPPRAGADLVEWWPGVRPQQVFERFLAQEITPARLLAMAPGAPAITDDRPFNEYYLLRRTATWRASARSSATRPG
jgi:predicted membrane-bound spermidine synthase